MTTWLRWAHQSVRGRTTEVIYMNFDSFRGVQYHDLKYPIVPVELTENPEGAYWGWVPKGKDDPILIWYEEGLFNMQFPAGHKAEEAHGNGHTIRLDVTPLHWIVWARRFGVHYRYFGQQHYARYSCGDQSVPLVQVRLDLDPEGAYWGWLDADTAQPRHVEPREHIFRIKYDNPPEEQEAKHLGRVARFRVIELPSEAAAV